MLPVVAIVEDNPLIRQTMTEMLEDVAQIVVDEGTAALEANASSCSADVFLMDNGLVAVEGEHYARATSSGEHQWSLLQLAGTSGGYCVEIGPDGG